MSIDERMWEEILFFASHHDWFANNNEIKWNIFNNNGIRDSLILSPNVYGKIRGDILAKISVSASDDKENTLNRYWEPGFRENTRSMDGFDNIVKWKADYTAEWIKGKLLRKAHLYYKQNNCEFFWGGRLLGMKRRE